jgi:hypothetical protein
VSATDGVWLIQPRLHVIHLRPSSTRLRLALKRALSVSPYVELAMAPHAGFSVDSIPDKSRRDLLVLLEAVSKPDKIMMVRELTVDRCEARRTLF